MKAVCMVAGAAQREAQWVRQTAKAGAGRALRSPNTTFPPAGASGRPTQQGGGGGGGGRGRAPKRQQDDGALHDDDNVLRSLRMMKRPKKSVTLTSQTGRFIDVRHRC